jgi:uncharacterized protein (TIGR02246 family)
MNFRRPRIALATLPLVAVLISGFSASTPAPIGSKSPSKAVAAHDETSKIPAQWAKLLQSKQIDQLAALYTADAVFLKPSGERITGRPAIRDLCKKIMDSFSSDFTFRSMTSDVSGNIAYDSGEYKESLVKISDKTKADVQGNYLMIFKRQPDGTWLIAQQMWTLVTPPTE